jgi:hypothetical protein
VFVNEVIPEADKRLHGFEENSRFYKNQPTEWTVDRSRNMFLILRLSYGPGGAQNVRFWAFSWQGKIHDLRIENISIETGEAGIFQATKRLITVDGNPALTSVSKEMLADLKEALSVYGVAGNLIPVKSFQLQLLLEDDGSTSLGVLS